MKNDLFVWLLCWFDVLNWIFELKTGDCGEEKSPKTSTAYETTIRWRLPMVRIYKFILLLLENVWIDSFQVHFKHKSRSIPIIERTNGEFGRPFCFFNQKSIDFYTAISCHSEYINRKVHSHNSFNYFLF